MPMIPEIETRQLLIDSCHSSSAEQRILGELTSPEFISLLVSIAVDADDYQGDAPMTAAYYLSKASPLLTKPHEGALLSLLNTADGYAGSVALVLGSMRSHEAQPIIARMAAAGDWPQEAFSEALSRYDA